MIKKEEKHFSSVFSLGLLGSLISRLIALFLSCYLELYNDKQNCLTFVGKIFSNFLTPNNLNVKISLEKLTKLDVKMILLDQHCSKFTQKV